MSKSITDLATLAKPEFQKFVDSFDTILTDCDGVLWLEMEALENAPNVINEMRKLGKRVFFVTNNSTKTREDFQRKAETLGFNCGQEDVMSSAYIAANYLQEKQVKKAYIIGSAGVAQELDRVGIAHQEIGPDILTDLGKMVESFVPDPEVGAVVVGFDPHISYVKLFKASSYLSDPNVHFIATNTDESFPSKKLIIPGTGSIVSAVATATGRDPTVMGKPFKHIVDAIGKTYHINPARTLMIGDRCNTDILLGSNCGFKTLLVLSGVNSLDDVKTFQTTNQDGLVPDYYLNKLGDMLSLLS